MGCTASSWRQVRDVQLNEALTDRQIQLVRDTWDLLSDDMEHTGLLIFERLFETDRDVKQLFKKINRTESTTNCDSLDMDYTMLKKHGFIVMEALGAAVESLEDSLILTNILISLGQVHHQHHVRPYHLPRLWSAIKYGFKEILLDVYSEEVEETWKIVFNYIISKMREGMKQQKSSDETSTAYKFSEGEH